MHTPTLLIRSFFVASVAFAGLAACGSDDDSSAEPTPADNGSQSDPGDDSSPDPTDSAPAGGDGTGTVTMTDGTVYEFEMSTCETSGTDDFVVPNSYDVFGKTSDGAFSVSFGRAGLDADFITEIVTLEGGFDEEGKNATIIYASVADTIDLVVDGGKLTGTVSLKAIGPPGPNGEETVATVDVSC